MRTLTGPLAGVVYHGRPWQPRYHRKFQARRAVVLAAVNHGWTFDECERVLLDDTAEVSGLWTRGEDGRDLGRSAAFKRLHGDFRAAAARAAASPQWRSRADVVQWLGEVTADAQSRPWPGRTGRTDKAVMLAVLARATRAGCDQPLCAVRDIAPAAGVTKQTAAVSLRRLCAAGWLERQYERCAPDQAQRYRVRQNQTGYSLGGSGDNLSSSGARPDAHPAHECWVRLGKTARDLWCALDAQPRTARALAARSQVSPRTAVRQLPKLASVRLSERRPAGWIAGPATPDDVVVAEGWIEANSKVCRRQARYDTDRELYHDPDWKKRRGAADAARRADELAARRAERGHPVHPACGWAHDPARECASAWDEDVA